MNKHVTSLIYCPRSKLCLGSSLIEHKVSLPCHFPTNLVCLCLESIKAPCFGHFLGPISTRSPCTRLKFDLFLLLIGLVLILLLVQTQQLRKDRRENFLLLVNRQYSAVQSLGTQARNQNCPIISLQLMNQYFLFFNISLALFLYLSFFISSFYFSLLLESFGF